MPPPNPLHDCVSVRDGLDFCYPTTKDGNYYLAFDRAEHPNPQNDPALFRPFMERIQRAPEPVMSPPGDIPAGSRTYNITGSLPPIISRNDWEQGNYPGPNCYHLAFCALGLEAAGFRNVCDRYVDTEEANYILDRYFEPVPAEQCGKRFGTVAVFSETKGGRPAGTHMALSLFGGTVIQKTGPHYNDGYRIDRIETAMLPVHMAALSHMDKFERLDRKTSPYDYSLKCYKLKETPPPVVTRPSSEKRKYYIGLFRFYSDMIMKNSRELTAGNRFDYTRLSMLSLETLSNLLRQFDGDNSDTELAQSHFEAMSLSSQYELMCATYHPQKEGRSDEINNRFLKEIYDKYYLKMDGDFLHEVYAHLHANNVPQEKWQEIAIAVKDEILRHEMSRRARPDYYRQTGANGIPFLRILANAIGR